MARGRPRIFSDKVILDAARDVFLEHGFNATTEEVARRAGVSEGILYHRFATKEGLFRAAMRIDGTDDPPPFKDLLGKSEKAEFATVLYDTAMGLIEYLRFELPLVMMSWSNPEKTDIEERLRLANDPPLRHLRLLTRLFEAKRRCGQFGAVLDPEAVALAFLGGVRAYVFMEVIYRRHEGLLLSPESFTRSLVHLILRGGCDQPAV